MRMTLFGYISTHTPPTDSSTSYLLFIRVYILFFHIVCEFFVEMKKMQSHYNFMMFAAFYQKSHILPSFHI